MARTHALTVLGTLAVSSGLTVVLFLASTVPQAQTATPAAPVLASISGTVRSATSGQPLEGATVTLYGPQFVEGRLTATTDEGGAFSFPRLAGGLYALGATKNGFANVGYRQRRFASGAPLFRVRDGEQMAVELSLPPTSAISGAVFDERGNPVARAAVRALRYNMSAGYLRPQDVGVATSDERGVYRIQSLQPGDYGICAATKATLPLNEPQRLQADIDALLRHLNLARGGSADSRRESAERIAVLEAKLPHPVDAVYGYAPRCTPQPFSSTPVRITVGPGEELAGIDIQFALARLARLDGVVTGLPDSGASSNLSVVLLAEESRDTARMDSAWLGPDRRFRFTNVPPGEYYLMVQDLPPGGGRTRLLASMPIVVADSDVSGIVLGAPRPATISGRVLFNGGAVPSSTALEGVRVYLDPSPRGSATRYQIRTSDLQADGAFTVSDVFPGAYRLWLLTTPPAEAWYSERSAWGAQDVFDQPLQVRAGQTVTDVTIHATDRIAELTGTVLDDHGEPATDYLVLVYPVEERHWNAESQRMPSTRAGRDGRFWLPILRPGQYRLATLLDVEHGAWFDPDFVRALEPGTIPISIAPREKKEIHLRVPRPK